MLNSNREAADWILVIAGSICLGYGFHSWMIGLGFFCLGHGVREWHDLR